MTITHTETQPSDRSRCRYCGQARMDSFLGMHSAAYLHPGMSIGEMHARAICVEADEPMGRCQ